mmetsp:Transcript_58943/g.182711  ORF Transcript_58943/g.182711 Transcript_58943/m.182711 type:complete len:292 (-) Transcript_58943:153-1028(-)
MNSSSPSVTRPSRSAAPASRRRPGAGPGAVGIVARPRLGVAGPPAPQPRRPAAGSQGPAWPSSASALREAASEVLELAAVVRTKQELPRLDAVETVSMLARSHSPGFPAGVGPQPRKRAGAGGQWASKGCAAEERRPSTMSRKRSSCSLAASMRCGPCTAWRACLRAKSTSHSTRSSCAMSSHSAHGQPSTKSVLKSPVDPAAVGPASPAQSGGLARPTAEAMAGAHWRSGGPCAGARPAPVRGVALVALKASAGQADIPQPLGVQIVPAARGAPCGAASRPRVAEAMLGA